MTEEQNYIKALNYSDKIRIEKRHEKSFTQEENNNFGTYFENSIVTKSCANLKIESIKDKNIFTKQYRHFIGLKILLIYSGHNKNERIKYIKDILDKGEYRVIPASSYSYSISFKKQKINVSFNGTQLKVTDFYNNYYLKGIKYADPTKAKEESDTSKFDKYLGTFYLFQDFGRKLELIIYSSEVEVDGLFEIFENIQLNSFGADKIYSNFDENFMSSKSLLIYEIKSGDQLEDLKEQMSKKCHFICNYLKVFYDKPIYYIGFYKNKKSKKIEINSDNSQSLNGNHIEEAKEINMKNKNEINVPKTEEKNKTNSDII